MNINVKHLGFTRAGKSILADIMFSLEETETLVIYGASGSGKTTLLRLLAGLERPDSGSICLNNTTVSDRQTLLPAHKRNCSLIFQELALWPHMTVNQHLLFGLKTDNLNAQHRAEKITDLLQRFELEAKSCSYPGQLSGGEQQRLAIARALVTSPEILLLDEALSNLDHALHQKIITLLQRLKQTKEISMVYVTHNLGEVLQLADKVLVLKSGKQQFFGSKESFAEKFQSVIQQSVDWYTTMVKNSGK